jgi:glutamyl-tRNA synthetase
MTAIPSPAPVGRLAPSPTGAQHLGNARTYLIAWLSARSRGGRVVLRIEDIDSPRVKPGAAEQAVEDLRWLGLDWDEGPVVQTERLGLYEDALRRLQERELVYPCTCTRADVERAASAPHLEHEGALYPGTCTGRGARDAEALTRAGRAFCWRFRVPAQSPGFADGFRGPTALDLRSAGGDFVVWKAAGSPAYQLSVVVDDAGQGVTEVVRGDDLVPSTPRQLLLYEALGLPAPSFAHVPLVVGPDGRRLAKRHGDTRLSALRAAGVPAQAVLGLLAWSCGWVGRIEPVRAADLLPRFRLTATPPSPLVLTPVLLAAIGYRCSEKPMHGEVDGGRDGRSDKPGSSGR